MNAHAENIENILWNNSKLKSSFDYDVLIDNFSSTNGDDFYIQINSSNKVKGIGFTILNDEYGLNDLVNLSKFPVFDIELISEKCVV